MKKDEKIKAITFLIVTSSLFGMQFELLALNLLSKNLISSLFNLLGMLFVLYPMYRLCDYLKEN